MNQLGWAGPQNPKLLIVGEAWGESEDMAKAPFVGSSGQELWRMLGDAALARGELSETWTEAANAQRTHGAGWIRVRETWLEEQGIAFTNTFNLRPLGNQIESLCLPKKELPHDYNLPPIALAKYLKPEHFHHLDRLQAQISASKPNLILACGNSALWALLRVTNIGSIRGSITAAPNGQKVLPTYHPAGVLRQWSWRPIVVADLIKAFGEAQFPEVRRPQRLVLVNPTILEIEDWVRVTLQLPPDLMAVDIETEKGQITCIGFARSRGNALVIPFVDRAKPGNHYWPEYGLEHRAWLAVKALLESPIPKLFQNGLYDLQYIMRLGLKPAKLAADSMLLHHSLWPEMQKGLGFLGSIYSNEASWKLMRRFKADSEKRDE